MNSPSHNLRLLRRALKIARNVNELLDKAYEAHVAASLKRG